MDHFEKDEEVEIISPFPYLTEPPLNASFISSLDKVQNEVPLQKESTMGDKEMEGEMDYGLEKRIVGRSSITSLLSSSLEANLKALLLEKEREIEEIEQNGSFEKVLARKLYALSLIAGEQLLEAFERGEVSPETLLKATTELSKTAFKLSGKEVQKHLHLNGETLERLLSDKE